MLRKERHRKSSAFPISTTMRHTDQHRCHRRNAVEPTAISPADPPSGPQRFVVAYQILLSGLMPHPAHITILMPPPPPHLSTYFSHLPYIMWRWSDQIFDILFCFVCTCDKENISGTSFIYCLQAIPLARRLDYDVSCITMQHIPNNFRSSYGMDIESVKILRTVLIFTN